jgi:hypothetical protein
MDEDSWREKFRVSDSEMERLKRIVSEISRSYSEDLGEPIDCVSVTFHFSSVFRFLEVSVAGSEPYEISDDLEGI